MSFTITTLEIPARTRKAAKRGSKYPLADLVAGSNQALIVPLEEGDEIEKLQSRLSSAVNTFRQSNKAAKFAIRVVDTEEGQAVAVWRVADRDMTNGEEADLVDEAEAAEDEAAY